MLKPVFGEKCYDCIHLDALLHSIIITQLIYFSYHVTYKTSRSYFQM